MSVQSGNWLAHIAEKFWLAVDAATGIPLMKLGVRLSSSCNTQTEYPQQNAPRGKYSNTAKIKESAAANATYTFLCLHNFIWYNWEWDKFDFIC